MARMILALLGLAAVASASDVLTLTTKNFDEALSANPLLLVEFYAPWCGHCKALAPEYEKAATEMKSADPAVALAKVDATADEALASKYDVRGFPTLKFFKDGEASEYAGGRTEATIVSWLKKKTGPPAKILTTVEEVKSFEKSQDVVVIGFFPECEDGLCKTLRKAFEDAAFDEEETPYGMVNDAAIATEYGVTQTHRIVVFKEFDEGKVTFTGGYNKNAIATFVTANALPLVVPFTQETAPKIFGGDIKTHVLLFLDPKDSLTDGYVEAATTAAKGKKGEVLFVTVGPEDDRILEFFSIGVGDIPAVRMVHMGDGTMRKYVFKGELTAAGLAAFHDQYKAGELSADTKSENIPENNAGPVRVVVGKSFDAEVIENEKDVLVEFYAPWCGHCKRLAPTFDELGEKFKMIDTVTIAKMDATENEHDKVDVQGFPTIKFWPGKDKANPIDFDGSRDVDGFVAFIKSKASTPFTFPNESKGKDEL